MSLSACILTKEAALDLNGANIPAFLQGQLTCDTRRLSPRQSVAGALCNPKGRVISDVWVLLVSANRLLLRLRASVAEPTAQILTRYAQFSRISVTPSTQEGSLLGLRADSPEDLQTPELASLPEAPGSVELSDDCYWLRRGPLHGEVGALNEHGVQVLSSIKSQLAQGLETYWQADDLRQGHYAIDEQDRELFTPQALNYDLTDRVAFDKGCYTGQEVVARLHYKGQSKRRLRVFAAPSEVRDPPGSKISDGQGVAVGKLLTTLEAAGGGCVVGAEILVEHGNRSAVTESGAALQAITDSGS